jgi:hypothetical protein
VAAGRKNKNKDESVQDSDEEGNGNVQIIRHIREDKPVALTKAENLDRAIEGKNIQMQLAMSMDFTEEH